MIADNPSAPTSATPDRMTTEARARELRGLLAKARSSCPAGAAPGSDAHRYWLNGVTRARIEIVNALPGLLDALEAREGEVARLLRALSRLTAASEVLVKRTGTECGFYREWSAAERATVAARAALAGASS